MLHVRERVGCVVCDVCLLLCEVYVRACFVCVSVVVVCTRVCVACVLCEFVEGWGWRRTERSQGCGGEGLEWMGTLAKP